MTNIISSIYNKIVYFQQKVIQSLNERDQRIILIAATSLTCLAALYATVFCSIGLGLKTRKENQIDDHEEKEVGDKKIKNEKDNLEAKKNVQVVDGDQQDKISIEHFLKAMDYMFVERRLDWEDHRPVEGDKKQRHEIVKQSIEKILPKHINDCTLYRDGMNTRQHTLLLQAIICIKDPAHRLEIVKLLLDKGAEPHFRGFDYDFIDPLTEARVIGDEELVQLISDALNKSKK